MNKASHPHSKSSVSISVWSYTDAVEFLRGVYEARKEQDKSFSYAVWASELGIKSRSFLRLVLVGKRSLTEDFAEQIVRSLKLNRNESRYFSHLVSLSRANTLEVREHHSRELSKLRQKFALKSHNIVEIQKSDLFDFLSSFKMPRLQVLLTLQDIERTEKNLAHLLNVKETEIAQHLQILQRLGLATQNEKGEWLAQETQLMTPDALGNVALQSFHKKSLEEAMEAINLPTETRRYQSLVMALTPEQFQELHEDLRAQLESTLQRFESSEGQNKTVYQVNLNIIPVTRPILRETNRAPVESEGLKKGTDNENN